MILESFSIAHKLQQEERGIVGLLIIQYGKCNKGTHEKRFMRFHQESSVSYELQYGPDLKSLRILCIVL